MSSGHIAVEMFKNEVSSLSPHQAPLNLVKNSVAAKIHSCNYSFIGQTVECLSGGPGLLTQRGNRSAFDFWELRV